MVFRSHQLVEDIGDQIDACCMTTSDGRHFNDLSFDQFDARVGRENSRFAHAFVFTDREVIFEVC